MSDKQKTLNEEAVNAKKTYEKAKADYEMERYMPKRIVFDFDSVTFMDSAGIGLLIGRYKFANMLGARLEISNLTQSVRRIFEMSGILKLIPIVDNN